MLTSEGRSHGFYEQMHQVLRERLVDAAAELICAEGWDALTMTRVASRVGVSRQAAYKQIGSKTALGEAVIARETERVLAGVIGRLRAHAPTRSPGSPPRPATCCTPPRATHWSRRC